MDLLAVMYAALDTRYGLVVSTNPTLFKQRFYALRADQRLKGVDCFDCLEVQTSPTNPDHQVWLVNKSEANLAEAVA